MIGSSGTPSSSSPSTNPSAMTTTTSTPCSSATWCVPGRAWTAVTTTTTCYAPSRRTSVSGRWARRTRSRTPSSRACGRMPVNDAMMPLLSGGDMATAERSRPPALTIREIHARAVRVPMRRPLGTSGGTIAYAPLVLVDLETAEGVPGRAYVFAYSALGARGLPPLIAGIAEMVRGDAVAPVAVAKKLVARFTLLGREGLPTMAMAGLDVALWDALGRAAGLPRVRLRGGELAPVRAYNSNALGLGAPEQLADEPMELLAEAFHAVKLRLRPPAPA